MRNGEAGAEGEEQMQQTKNGEAEAAADGVAVGEEKERKEAK